MEKAYESLSLFEFQHCFSTDNQCLAYLSAEKMEKRLYLSEMQPYALLRRRQSLFEAVYSLQTH